MAKIPAYDSLSALYSGENLGKELDQDSEFTINRLEKAHPNPIKSPVFRANYYSFVLIRVGKTNYSIDGHTFHTRPNTLYFTNPGHLKSFTIIEPAKGFLITVSDSFLIQHIDDHVFDEFTFLLTEMVPPCFLSESEFSDLAALARQIESENLKDTYFRQKIISSYFKVFLFKIKEYLLKDQSFTQEYNRESQILNTFKLNLEAHFRDLVQGKISRIYNVRDYAELQNLHPNYLSTVIKTKTGNAPHAHIRDKVIVEAKALLQKSDYSVKEVAYSLAFSEPTNFSKFFKRETGLAPAAYRKQSRSL